MVGLLDMGVKRDKSETEWRDIVEGRRRSGLTVRKYCEREGIREYTFYKWRRRIEGASKSTAREVPKQGIFRELPLPTVIPAPATCPWAVELVLSSGVTVRVRG